jgi:endonuclease I
MRQTRSSFLTTLLLLTLSSSSVQAQDYTWNYDDCDVDRYYSSLLSNVEDWTKDDLETLLFDTHRNSLVYTRPGLPGVDDVWAALIDVDVGSVPDTVKLLYTDDQMDSIPFGQRGWIKEHIWPILNITEQLANEGNELGKHVTDMHNIRPVDPLSDVIRGNKFFGECGVLSEDPETCQVPAEGGADNTCVCQKVYTPPESKKGEIARALLYMDVRYGSSDRLSPDFKLTDCPRVPYVDMGYLSQMLQWHFDNPPTAEEIERNNKVCTNWQGNRNPFVDYPELASVLYYEPFPLPVIGERTTYEACDKIPSLPPTPTPNICDTEMFPSDIYIWLVNSIDPDTVAMYTFSELPEGLELYMTDNPWNGTEFVEDLPDVDGTLKVRVGMIVCGTNDNILCESYQYFFSFLR